ncbi:hypothetical protein [Aeromicrobium sp.]|uniref:hypothetical protein n=1 Tax=Aeromicrobium sp. TaxID=1871063 RepID=UPI002FCB5CEF
MRQPPKKSAGREVVQAVVEGALGAIPIAGSPLAASFVTAVDWRFNRRTAEWMEDLASAVDELQAGQGISFEDLAENEAFVDAVINATRAAQATHQTEKLQALRNAVLHSLDDDAPDVDEQARFIRLIEQFTPSHIRLLVFLNDPGKAFDSAGIPRPNLMMGGRSTLLEQGVPEFAGRRDWYDLLAGDIDSARLAQTNMHTTMTGAGLWNSATTQLGSRFLAFIADPT